MRRNATPTANHGGQCACRSTSCTHIASARSFLSEFMCIQSRSRHHTYPGGSGLSSAPAWSATIWICLCRSYAFRCEEAHQASARTVRQLIASDESQRGVVKRPGCDEQPSSLGQLGRALPYLLHHLVRKAGQRDEHQRVIAPIPRKGEGIGTFEMHIHRAQRAPAALQR